MDKIVSIGCAAKEFRFTLDGDERVWSMPLMTSLPVRQAAKIAKVAKSVSIEAQTDALCDLFDAVCPGLIDAITIDQAAEVLRAWGAASGITPGESSAPSQP